jgi:hypothetical protein
MLKNCFINNNFTKNCNFINKYKYLNTNSLINTKSLKILTCSKCDATFAGNLNYKTLNNYYSTVYNRSYYLKTLKSIQNNNFYEYNRRFFSQVVFYLQTNNLFKNIKVLEIGPNIQGILPSLNLFQKKISYFYYEQTLSEIIKKTGRGRSKRLGNYFTPKKKLPKVDLIWMSHSMEHINPKDLRATFIKFYKALNNNGKIFIEIPNDLCTKNFTFPHIFFYSEKFLRLFFKSLNYKIESISFFTHNFHNDKKFFVDTNNKSKLYELLNKYMPIFLIDLLKIFFRKNLINYSLINNQYVNENNSFIRIIIKKNPINICK